MLLRIMTEKWIQFSKQFPEKASWIFTFLTWTMNECAEIRTLMDGFSKPTCFYRLSLVKLIEHSPNKSWGTGSHFIPGWNGPNGSQAGVTCWDACWEHLGGFMMPGAASPELLNLGTHRMWQKSKSHHRRPSLSMGKENCALDQVASASKYSIIPMEGIREKQKL